MHRALVYDRLTRSIEVCIEQQFTQVMLLASKKARINRLLTNAQSIEICSEQPFSHSCSKLQSMYGAIVYSGMLESSEVCTEQHFFSVML